MVVQLSVTEDSLKSRVRYLLDVGLKFRNGGLDETCLEVCDLAKGLDGYDTLRLGVQRIHQPLDKYADGRILPRAQPVQRSSQGRYQAPSSEPHRPPCPQ